MQIKRLFMHPAEPGQSILGKAPEPFDSVNVSMAFNKFIAAMIDPQMLSITQIHQSVIAAPTVGVDY